jgi:hypothetical protein
VSRSPWASFRCSRPFLDLRALHRLHGVGQDQDLEAAYESVLGHRQHVGVEEGLASGEADLARPQSEPQRSRREGAGFGGGDIDEPVVGRARLDIAVGAGDVAQRAGVDPQRVQPLERHLGARRALRGQVGIAELAPVERDKAACGGISFMWCAWFSCCWQVPRLAKPPAGTGTRRSAITFALRAVQHAVTAIGPSVRPESLTGGPGSMISNDGAGVVQW